MLLFSNLNKIVFGYFDPEFVYTMMKIINFQGDLTESLAKMEPLDTKFLLQAIHILIALQTISRANSVGTVACDDVFKIKLNSIWDTMIQQSFISWNMNK